jgi:Domain of unknown function (DUF4383)
MISDRTPAQLYSLLFGAVLLAIGAIGFAVDGSFDTGGGVQGDELILFEVNGWHNVVHVASGVLGIALAGSRAGARAFALGFGAIYLVVAAWGFVDGSSVLGLVAVNTSDNLLHLAIAALGLGAGLASSAEPVGHTGAAAPSTR